MKAPGAPSAEGCMLTKAEHDPAFEVPARPAAPGPSTPSVTSQHPLGRQGRHHAVRELVQQRLVEDHEIVVAAVHAGLEALWEEGAELRVLARHPHLHHFP